MISPSSRVLLMGMLSWRNARWWTSAWFMYRIRGVQRAVHRVLVDQPLDEVGDHEEGRQQQPVDRRGAAGQPQRPAGDPRGDEDRTEGCASGRVVRRQHGGPCPAGRRVELPSHRPLSNMALTLRALTSTWALRLLARAPPAGDRRDRGLPRAADLPQRQDRAGGRGAARTGLMVAACAGAGAAGWRTWSPGWCTGRATPWRGGHPGRSGRTSSGRSASTTSTPRPSRATTSSRPTATTASPPCRCWARSRP